jgi:hypothetical protein
MKKANAIFLFVLFLLCGRVTAQDKVETAAPQEAASGEKSIGYVDENRDGLNDRFRDANGDGVDDVSKKKYAHRFRFVDEDGDGINDLFVDRDGDGVNDLHAQYVDADAVGICDNVVDFDGDWINDITGLKFDPKSLQGFRYGLVDEERGEVHRHFLDRDGDGMHDMLQQLHRRGGAAGLDRFIDEDGDGIADGRHLRRRLPKPVLERLKQARGKRPPRKPTIRERVERKREGGKERPPQRRK